MSNELGPDWSCQPDAWSETDLPDGQFVYRVAKRCSSHIGYLFSDICDYSSVLIARQRQLLRELQYYPHLITPAMLDTLEDKERARSDPSVIYFGLDGKPVYERFFCTTVEFRGYLRDFASDFDAVSNTILRRGAIKMRLIGVTLGGLGL